MADFNNDISHDNRFITRSNFTLSKLSDFGLKRGVTKDIVNDALNRIKPVSYSVGRYSVVEQRRNTDYYFAPDVVKLANEIGVKKGFVSNEPFVKKKKPTDKLVGGVINLGSMSFQVVGKEKVDGKLQYILRNDSTGNFLTNDVKGLRKFIKEKKIKVIHEKK